MKTILLTILVFSQISFADAENEAAVKEVQDQMKSPEFHKKAAKESPQAKEVEKYVKEISGSGKSEQEIYNLAAEVLGNLKGSDPEAMKQLLEQAGGNPENFANSWTPEQKKKLKEISARLPAATKDKP